MVSVRHLQGTFCHLEKVHLPKGHSRRHKSRCTHYDKSSNHCSYRFETCIGSAQCPNYQEKKISPDIIKNNTTNLHISSKSTHISKTQNTYEKNMLIYSPKYGHGKIIDITFDEAKNKILNIDFHGTKIDFLAEYNDLHIIKRTSRDENKDSSKIVRFSIKNTANPKNHTTFSMFEHLRYMLVLHPVISLTIALSLFAIIILIYYVFFS